MAQVGLTHTSTYRTMQNVAYIARMDHVIADDTMRFLSIKNIDSSIQKWSERNSLPFNMAKYKKISLTRTAGGLPHHTYVYPMGGAPHQEVDCVWDMGILINRAVTFKEHIVQKMEKVAGLRNTKLSKL